MADKFGRKTGEVCPPVMLERKPNYASYDPLNEDEDEKEKDSCVPTYSCDSTCTLLKNADYACTGERQKNQRARQFGTTLGKGVFGLVGVGDLAGKGISAAEAGTEKAGGIINDDKMISTLSSTLDGIRWGVTQTLIDSEEGVQQSLLQEYSIMSRNAKKKLQNYEQQYIFETDMLDTTQITLFICLSSAIFYILQHL